MITHKYINDTKVNTHAHQYYTPEHMNKEKKHGDYFVHTESGTLTPLSFFLHSYSQEKLIEMHCAAYCHHPPSFSLTTLIP